MKTLVQYSNKLPGLMPDVDAAQMKKLNMDALTNLTQFMSNEKSFADVKDGRRNHKHQGKDKKSKNGGGKKGCIQSSNYNKNNKDWDLY
eukprot:7241125-Ditylum_brightwellii.AAC.2